MRGTEGSISALTDAGAERAKARALAAQPTFAVVGGNGGSRADRAKARALATQPNLAGVGNACGGRTDFHGVFSSCFCIVVSISDATSGVVLMLRFARKKRPSLAGSLGAQRAFAGLPRA